MTHPKQESDRNLHEEWLNDTPAQEAAYWRGLQAVLAASRPTGDREVPARAESAGTIGDGVLVIGPDDPQYAAWQAWWSSLSPDVVTKATAEADAWLRAQRTGSLAELAHDAAIRFPASRYAMLSPARSIAALRQLRRK